jgi:hypothetical protein
MAVTTNYGAAPTYVKIASQTSGAVSSVTFSNIPQGYTDLLLVCNAANNTGNGYLVQLQFNDDTSTNYSATRLHGNGSSVSSLRESGLPAAWLAWTTTVFSTVKIDILNYSNAATNKTSISRWGTPAYRSGSWVALWRSTAPITSIKILSESPSVFTSGSTFTIYGIKAALFPKATGGDVVVNDGTYWYHAFRTTGAFVPNSTLSCDALVIAGGGSGGTAYGNQAGGGGGAGGYQLFTSQSISTAQTVTVGAGGAGVGTSTLSAGVNGSNSQFGSLTASVGGGRGGSYSTAPAIGGSGGGGGNQGSNTTGAAATSGQGFAGGNGSTNPNAGAGGGGGAGAAGSAFSAANGGNGGAGKTTEASWLYATGTGVSGYIAGGGGGTKGADGSANGTGGSGGGGAGNSNADGFYGTVNTGSGGGGAYGDVPYYTSGVGGSGLVIVRYPI